MDWSKRRIRLLLIVGAAIGMLAVGAHAAFLDSATPTSGSVPIVANDGPNVTVQGDTNISLSDPTSVWPDDNTVNLLTESGNLTATSTGRTNLSVDHTEITGTWTNLSSLDVSSNEVTVNPEDKEKVSVTGAATDLSFTDYALDDGQTDIVIAGPDGTESDVTLYNLTANVKVSLVNASTGTAVAVTETDSNGKATFTVPHSEKTLLLESGDSSSFPELTNPSPTGDLSTPPDELSIDVNDSDFPDDNVTVNITFDGSQVKSTSIESNQTVTYTITKDLDAGIHTWEVNATDKFGNSEVESYEFSVPGFLYFFNETPNATDQHELLDDVNITVEGTITGSEGTAFKRTVRNGSLNLTGFPADETFIVTADAEGYFVRSAYLPNLYEQNAIFLLNKSIASTENTVRIDDNTGEFTDNPVLITQRVINTSNVTNISDNGYQWVTIGGDRLGADNEFIAHFEQDQRYRFKVISSTGNTRVLGEYTAELDGPITLEIGSIQYDIENESKGYVWLAEVQNETGSHSIQFAYNDKENLTSELRLEIRNRDTGTVIVSERFSNGPYGEVVYTEPISKDQYENESFIVEWEADRDSDTVGAQGVVGSKRPIDLPLDGQWTNILYGAVTLLLAFVVGVGISPGAGAVTVGLWSGVAWYIELIPAEIGAGVVILVIAIGVWTTLQEQQPEPI